MKRVTLFLMACCMSIMAFAEGGDITYVLNGGVTNDDGWTSKSDMLQAFSADYNTVFKKTTAWGAATKPGDIVAATYPDMYQLFEDETIGPNWEWLKDYILDVSAELGYAYLANLQSGAAGNTYWRAAIDGFFTSSHYLPGAWNGGPDFTYEGLPQAFIPAWGHGFAGPDSYDGSVEIFIPAPYKAGSSFYGWYAEDDFSGDKVISIPAGTEGDITLYAKWGDYIPNCKEVQELEAGESITVEGVVTYVSGTTVIIQDAKGGLLIEFAAAPTIARGNKITVEGKTAGLDEYIQLIDAELLNKESDVLPTAPKVLLTALASKIFRYVTIESLTITGYSGNYAIISDGTNTISFKAGLSTTTFPVNTKISIKAVVSYTDEFILVGVASDVTAAPVPRPDPGVYPAKGEKGQYTLTNKWLVSNVLDNFTANLIGTSGFVRGMTAQDGIMYFIDREKKQLTLVNGATGAKLEPIKLAANIFTREEADTPATLNFNDIKQDAAGNILLGNCVSHTQYFQIWKIDLATGAGTLILEERLADNPDFAAVTVRFDAFGVYGDVDGDAIIMAANASAMEAYKWVISGGVAGKAELIPFDTTTEGTFLTALANPGSAPQILPIDENYFYLDGNATLPTLIDTEGNIIDGFFNVPKDIEDWSVGLGNKAGHNGLREFELGGEYFLIMADGNTAASPASTFRLLKFKDANREFKDIESLWKLPAAGMGSASNAYRTAVPWVEVNEATKTATIYVYTGENGYGVYEFKIGEGSGIKLINKDTFFVFNAGDEVQFSEKLASVKVYNLAGQLVRSAQASSSVKIAGSGVYIINGQTLKGDIVTQKVIVK